MRWRHVRDECRVTESGIMSTCEGNDSINVMFTPDTPEVRTVLGNFVTAHAARSGVSLTFDSVPHSFYSELSPPTSPLGLIPVPSSDFINDYVLKYPNSTLLGIDFNITSTTYKYQVWYNASLFAGPSNTDFFSPQLLYLERTLEEAILNATGHPTIFNVTLRPFPTLQQTTVPDTLSSSLGPCFFFIVTALPTILMALNALVSEKEKHLRRCMMLMGLRLESWYMSWYLTFAIISALVGLILAGLGRAFHFDFFVNSNFGVVFLTFWLHSLAELSLSFFAMVWMRHTSTAVLFATFW
jgi:ABC-2 family transporter protein